MSAPNTDVEKQEKRHKGPLIGMGAAVAWGVGLLIAVMVYVFVIGGDPEGAETQVDGRTGDAEPAAAEGAASE